MNGIKIMNLNASDIKKAMEGVYKGLYCNYNAVLTDSRLLDRLKKDLTIQNKKTRDVVGVQFLNGYDNKDKGVRLKADELREEYYKNGFYIDFTNKNGEIERITYKYFFRSSAKARVGDVIFINQDLLSKTKHKDKENINKWITMGIEFESGEESKIVEMEAYKSLVSSSIENRVEIKAKEILVINDIDEMFKCNVAEVGLDKKNNVCVAEKVCEVKNTLFDGQALLDATLFYDYGYKDNSFMLLRARFFKACGFMTDIQKFLKDYFKENQGKFGTKDYYRWQLTDRYGTKIYAKNIKMITTENAMKWEKFYSDKSKGKKVWDEALKQDENLFGVCKTDHKSKFGNRQRMSYQMLNTLPINESSDINTISEYTLNNLNDLRVSIDEDGNDVNIQNYIELLDNNKSIANANEMFVELYRINKDIAKTEIFKKYREEILAGLTKDLKKGKLLVEGDNLTVVGNPYAMLLASVGAYNGQDITLDIEPNNGYISCYTNRFAEGEMLAGFRNPHNAPNNIIYMSNQCNEYINEYFNFNENIIAVNGINTPVQDRANGMDMDSDFMFVTNNEIVVNASKLAWDGYRVIVNKIPQKTKTYTHDMENYANVDNGFAKGKMAIGESSNLSQIALSHYWNTKNETKKKKLLDIVQICSVLAQVAIDNAKREFDIDVVREIANARIMLKKIVGVEVEYNSVNRKGVQVSKNKIITKKPEFMKSTKKKGKRNAVDNSYYTNNIICPMSMLQTYIKENKGKSDSVKEIDIADLVIVKDVKNVNYKQTKEITEEIKELDAKTKDSKSEDNETEEGLLMEDVVELIKKRKINEETINRLICACLGLVVIKTDKTELENKKYKRKMLNVLFQSKRKEFLDSFVKG